MIHVFPGVLSAPRHDVGCPSLSRRRSRHPFLAALTAMRLVALVALLCIPAVAEAQVAAAAAAQSPDPTDPSLSPSQRLEALIARVEAEQKKIETLEASFRMERESDLLLEPSVSTGTLYYSAPDRVRWEYKTPDPMILVIADGELTTWYQDLGEAERASIAPYSQRALQFFNASNSVSALLEYFDARLRAPDPEVEDSPWRLALTPADARVARRVTSLTLWIDPRAYVPVQVRLEDADGAVTQYVLEDQRTNIELAADLFQLELPDDVEVRALELPGG